MRPCENVIVSIQLEKEIFDMELPTFLPIKELNYKLEETFRVMRPSNQTYGHISLSHNGKNLDPQKNLAHYGIWDGSILVCRCVKEQRYEHDLC